MSQNLARIQKAGKQSELDAAFLIRDKKAIMQILQESGFSEIEIEAIIWRNSLDFASSAPREKKSQRIIGNIGLVMFFSATCGLSLALSWSHLDEWFNPSGRYSDQRRYNLVMQDTRSPFEAFVVPLILGCAFGAVVGVMIAASRKSTNDA